MFPVRVVHTLKNNCVKNLVVGTNGLLLTWKTCSFKCECWWDIPRVFRYLFGLVSWWSNCRGHLVPRLCFVCLLYPCWWTRTDAYKCQNKGVSENVLLRYLNLLIPFLVTADTWGAYLYLVVWLISLINRFTCCTVIFFWCKSCKRVINLEVHSWWANGMSHTILLEGIFCFANNP